MIFNRSDGLFPNRYEHVIVIMDGTSEIVMKRAPVKPVPAEKQASGLLGCMIGKVKIVGDIESSIPVTWAPMPSAPRWIQCTNAP